jgi:hypothetical protein
MQVTKVSGSYDTYKVELSWSELKAIEAALAAHHAGVIADETFARMQFYMARIPGPGEEKEKGSDNTLEQTQAKTALKMAGDTEPGELEPDDIPMPGGGGGEDRPLPGGEGPELEPEAEEVIHKEVSNREPPRRATPRGGGDIELEHIPFPGSRLRKLL